MSRVYWKDVVKKEEQKGFLREIIDMLVEPSEIPEEAAITLRDKNGDEVGIYIPKEDFKELDK